MIIRLDPGGPIDLEGLGASFAALARFYARHHGQTQDADTSPRLFISKLENGSVIAEIVPYIVMLGQAVPFMQQAVVIANFTDRVAKVIRAFSGAEIPAKAELPSKDDARDIKEFIKPLVGRRGADLKISHARFERHDGEKTTILEYRFDETELNRATLTIDAELANPALPSPQSEQPPSTKTIHEAMLFFQQASRAAGKSAGRTGDRAIIPSVSEKPLPVYFVKDAGLKEQMVQGQTNPLTDTTYIIDAEVQLVDGEPKGYVVTHVHRVIEGDE
ncbi:hypothetical protein IVB03_02965 [Bradyrhizobium sp. 168]|uniref:hypothetical protein n=1 Tax=Bradyrhizobium sp. 168 TaxID=2782639 RepID=UPI001FF98DD2|nr:hypothetical protein [Bradyrhizobium sp. 168]MCK1578569.1 hypothetical protein [Bradyrhizobium sp. 168]